MTFPRSSLFCAAFTVDLYWVFSPQPPNICQPLTLLAQHRFRMLRSHLIQAHFLPQFWTFKWGQDLFSYMCCRLSYLENQKSEAVSSRTTQRKCHFPPQLLKKCLCVQCRQKEGGGDKGTIINRPLKSKNPLLLSP